MRKNNENLLSILEISPKFNIFTKNTSDANYCYLFVIDILFHRL